MKRRDFIEFLGRTSLATTLPITLTGCFDSSTNAPFTELAPTSADTLSIANGFNWQILIKEHDPLNSTRTFGSNNDYICYTDLPGKTDEGILWVNHEACNSLFISGYNRFLEHSIRTLEQVNKEMKQVGGSLLHVKRDADGNWQYIKDSKYNRRLDAKTKIPFADDKIIQGQNHAMGTLANCAGGKTPWNTVLSCEENFSNYFGGIIYKNGKRIFFNKGKTNDFAWYKFYRLPPEHYGWVVEIDPLTGVAKKHTSMGRYSHESATVYKTPSGRCVVYSGDDENDEHLYKFVADKPGSLDKGELFVADTNNGRWISLKREKHKVLQDNFKSQLDIQTYTRVAAKLVGATPLDRPEDVEIDPLTNNVFVALTNNKKRGNYHGSIIKIEPKNNDHLSEEFNFSTFLAGSKDTGFSCPDNLAFDKKGGLWMCCDVSTKRIGKKQYKPFKNNSLFYIPTTGDNAGKAFRVAAAPVEAELTGLCFSSDYKQLFVSVQHPGENSKSLGELTSSFPHGISGKVPLSTVVTISGKLLEELTA